NWIAGPSFGGDNAGMLRFNGDLGGKVEYGADTVESHLNALDVATLAKLSDIPGAKNPSLNLNTNQNNYHAQNKNRSSYVGFHTFNNVGKGYGNNFSSTGYDGNGIADMAIYNEEGMKYVYGQPVFTRSETNLQVDVEAGTDAISNRYLAYKNLPLLSNGNQYQLDNNVLNTDNLKTAIGEIKNQPYTAAHLLTQITTPDYVDVNSDGPDSKDFGGWTKFSYRQSYGGAGNWYRYRTPYTGLLYSQNSVSDLKDDLGSVLTGEKEVYYLNQIETKTHIAYFVTNKTPVVNGNPWLSGSQQQRLDGLGAARINGQGDPAAAGTSGSDQLEYLEKIVLFAKARPNQPIKVVRFSYDYSLVQNLPNNLNGDFPKPNNDANNLYNTSSDPAQPSQSGKLT
ncbi:MAG TPA: hypothetical protein VNZ86_20845, partial [Bacteroidia bacterium]|nr:hypothetical protein [Bacteroidia bacterium]